MFAMVILQCCLPWGEISKNQRYNGVGFGLDLERDTGMRQLKFLWKMDGHRIFDFCDLERRFWNRRLGIWIEQIDVYSDSLANAQFVILELMVPVYGVFPEGISQRSVEQLEFPERTIFIYDESDTLVKRPISSR
jgi:hypothetical protein